MKKNEKTALIVEGGGMRGIFAAGVLDCFLEKKFDPFDIYIGASAGACNLASHLGEQHGRNYRCYTDYMLRPDFFSFKKYLKGGHYMDLDWFWDYVTEVEPLNTKNASRKDFYVTVTNVQTGKADYLRASVDNLFDALKASSAVPLMYRKIITINGMGYTDGGVADPIPVEEAYNRGAKKIIVIRSQQDGYNKKSFIESKCIPLLFLKYPSLKQALSNRESQYNKQLNYIKNPPSDAKIMELCPKVLHSGRTTRDRELLKLDYNEGKRIGMLAMENWKNNNFS